MKMITISLQLQNVVNAVNVPLPTTDPRMSAWP